MRLPNEDDSSALNDSLCRLLNIDVDKLALDIVDADRRR